MAEWILTLLQEHPMRSNISRAACSRPWKVPTWTHSDLTAPVRDPAAALSHGDDMAPMEGLMPFSLMVLPSNRLTYCAP